MFIPRGWNIHCYAYVNSNTGKGSLFREYPEIIFHKSLNFLTINLHEQISN